MSCGGVREGEGSFCEGRAQLLTQTSELNQFRLGGIWSAPFHSCSGKKPETSDTSCALPQTFALKREPPGSIDWTQPGHSMMDVAKSNAKTCKHEY